MSFWTLLKYKVPDIRNKEEILSLPDPIIMAWWDKIWTEIQKYNTSVRIERQPRNPEEVFTTYMESWLTPITREDVDLITNLLIKAMMEYEE
jgi:hypothetical protein